MRFLGLFLATCCAIAAEKPTPPDSDEAAYPALKRFVEVLETVRNKHPDLDKVTYERMINHALDGMLSSMDRHSSFIHPEMQQFISTEGELDNEIPSLGLSLGKNAEHYFISAVEPGSPAAKADILPGTAILVVNGNTAPENALEMLQGEPGAQTTLLLRNPERPGEITVTLTHRFVEERSLIEASLLKNHPETGYLRLDSFGTNCAHEVETALDDLEDQGMKSLILDLRGNGGGHLHETVKILGLFLPPNTKVVSIRERDKPEEFLQTATRQRRKREYPIAILIDRNSASASELSAAALQDLKRATIIGERSYGKGSVQNIIPMGNNTALRLTIATYHSPSGATPHEKGVEPDLKIDFTEQDRRFFRQAGRASSLTDEEKTALATWQDPAILAALEQLAK